MISIVFSMRTDVLSKRHIKHTTVGGVRTAIVTEVELINRMIEDCASYRSGKLDQPVTVMDINGQGLSMYAQDKNYASTLDSADIVHADGQFIVWMSNLGSREPVPERTATTDLFLVAAKAAAQKGLRVFLLGATAETVEACANTLEHNYPGLQIVGYRNGYFSENEEAEVIAQINACDADIVWVGLGKPKEQLFTQKFKSQLNCAWIATCGGCFNFVIGNYPRAPIWMQKAGLEWLHRMATGPRYLVGRYIYTNVHAIGLVISKDFLQPLLRTNRKS